MLKEHVSCFGVPSRLIADRGTSFAGRMFKGFIALYGVERITGAVATPRASGRVERFNRAVTDALSTCNHSRDEGSWDESVYDVRVGVDTTINGTTRRSL